MHRRNESMTCLIPVARLRRRIIVSEVRYVVNVIVYEDGHCDVIWDSSVTDEDCYRALKQVTQDMENALGVNPPTPPRKPPTITRLK